MSKVTNKDQPIVLGIDLGTSYSFICIYKNDKLEVIPNEFKKTGTPSMVSFYRGEKLVGQ